MSALGRLLARVGRFFGRETSALFQDLPPVFGDTVPPELRVFEAQAEEHDREADAEPWDVPRPQGNPGAQERRAKGNRAEPPPRSVV